MKNNQTGSVTIWALIVGVLLIVGGIVYTMNNKETSTVNQTPTNNQNNNTQGQMMGPVEVQFSGQNDSGQDGLVTLTEINGQTKVTIEIKPGPAGVAQPAHIHAGDCNTLGSIRYNLNDVVDGKSETILQPALHFIHGLGQTAVNVHKSKAEISVYAGCGNLTEAFNNTMHTGPATVTQ